MEPLILYFVLFFPGIFNSPAPELNSGVIPFSLLREAGRTLTYTIPSLALLWYIMSDKKGFSALEAEKPGKKDVLPLIIGFPGLIIIGLVISFLITLFPGSQGLVPPPKVEAPVNAAGWIIMVFSCLGTGYLEESYFRFYLLSKLENLLPQAILRIVLSTVLFAACHIYEGPWGILNAVLASALLSVLFIRWRSLHSIALAHGAYNIFVYVMGIFTI